MKQEKGKTEYYTIEREFIGKITSEELIRKIIKIRLDNNDNQNVAK